MEGKDLKYIGSQHGKVGIYEKEIPEIKRNYVLIKTSYSAISPGTELKLLSNSQDKIVRLGYSASGVVEGVGEDITEFKVGDRVTSYGSPYTRHDEYLLVPKTMCTIIPDNVSLKNASLGGVGSIAIHALRRPELQFGEIIIVAGLGVYGQLIGQIALNAGYQVLGLDPLEERAKLFNKATGIPTFTNENELEDEINQLTNGKGADAVFLCAGKEANYLTNKSLEWLKDKGKSVIVGDLQPDYKRDLMFMKEIDIIISRAGGPGRYDPVYEKEAVDYPYGFVRWTETDNLREFIRLISEERISLNAFPHDIVELEDAAYVYNRYLQGEVNTLTSIFKY